MDINRCYEILKIGPDATLDEVRRAYKTLVKQWHPDRYTYNPQLKAVTEKQLQQINLAFEVLSQHLAPKPAFSILRPAMVNDILRYLAFIRNGLGLLFQQPRKKLRRISLKTFWQELFSDPPSYQRESQNATEPNGTTDNSKSSTKQPAFEDIYKQVVEKNQTSPVKPKTSPRAKKPYE